MVVALNATNVVHIFISSMIVLLSILPLSKFVHVNEEEGADILYSLHLDLFFSQCAALMRALERVCVSFRFSSLLGNGRRPLYTPFVTYLIDLYFEKCKYTTCTM